MNNCENYLVDLPYPSVTPKKPNTYYAALISGAFGGPGSESTAIAQYTAHNFYTLDYPEINFAYRCIASVEVTHLNLLGNLIRDLGLHPKFLTYETNCYWTGKNPVYAYKIRPILLSDLKGEHDAIAHYTKLIKQIDAPDIQRLFQRIILDEQKHIEILTSLLETIKS